MDQSSRFIKHKAFVNYLAVAHPVQLKNLLHSASEAELTTVWEILVNFLAGNIKSEFDFSQRTAFLKTLASRSVDIERKRIILDGSRVYRSVLQRLINSLI
jgi:hypothetical protein